MAGRALVVVAAVSLSYPLAASDTSQAGGPNQHRVDLHAFRVVKRDSGPINYYSFVDQPPLPYIHAAYRPPYETTVLGYALPDALRGSVASLSWKWRALALPRGGNECADGD